MTNEVMQEGEDELLDDGDLKKQVNNMDDSIYFNDVEKGDIKLVDFVLVWEEKLDDPHWSSNKKKREIFLQNLELEGLELEQAEFRGGNNLRFIKIHAPMEVLRRYAEILKIRMPIKVTCCKTL